MEKFFDEISPKEMGEYFYDEIGASPEESHEESLEMFHGEKVQIKEGNTYNIPLVY